ncbi:ankyrin repeat domain-containing protein [candidate division KSB1 bacterium]
MMNRSKIILIVSLLAAVLLGCSSAETGTTTDEDGRNPLHIAVLKEDSAATAGLTVEAAFLDQKDRYGYTPLHYAIKKGNRRIVELLISKGASVNSLNNYSESPLHWAAIKGHQEIIKILLENDADPFIKDNGGRIPAHAALDQNDNISANLLFPLHNAVGDNDTEMTVRLLRQHPELIDSSDSFGRTALHKGYRFDSSESVELLKSLRASEDIKDDFGYLPKYYSSDERAKRTESDLLNKSAEQKVDDLIYSELTKYDNINVALVYGDEIVYSKSYGEGSLNKTYAWGSISKPVTGMIVMQLLNEGIIESLDDNIWKYSSRYRNCMPDEFSDAPLTIRHLLIHMSGIPHNNERTWNGNKLNLKFRPGEKDMYSTPAYGVLGHVLEDVTGQTYSRLVKKYIGEPVGADSYFAEKHFRAPGARVNSTIRDMALFAKGVIDNVYFPENILYEQVIKRYNSLTGISWQIMESEGEDVTIFHGGSNGRPQAFLIIKPRKKLSVCILATRKDRYSYDLNDLGERLMSVIDTRENIKTEK